jgi:hypothetical protein
MQCGRFFINDSEKFSDFQAGKERP